MHFEDITISYELLLKARPELAVIEEPGHGSGRYEWEPIAIEFGKRVYGGQILPAKAEQAVGIDQKTAMSIGGALSGPVTAFLYDWNMLPIGQQLWLKHLLSFEQFPPLQAPEAYNLSGIIAEVKKATGSHASD